MTMYEVSLYASKGDRYKTVYQCPAESAEAAERLALQQFPEGAEAFVAPTQHESN